MTLHPAFRAYLDELNPLIEQAARSGVRATPESARAALKDLTRFALPPVEIAHVFDSAAVTGDRSIPVRVYVPRPDVPSDTVLFVHGGGHMAGDVDVYDWSARRTAAATGMVVVSVDYRRSPEARYPAGLTDVIEVLERIEDVVGEALVTGTVHAMADSGGAAKVASIAQRHADEGVPSPISRQVLLYPSLDYTMSGESYREYGTGYFLSAERVAWYFDHYFPDGADRAAASPLSGPFSPTMPRTLVIAAECDPLRSEAEEYVARMTAARADARLLVATGMIHAFAFFETLIPEEISRLYSIIGDFLADGQTTPAW